MFSQFISEIEFSSSPMTVKLISFLSLIISISENIPFSFRNLPTYNNFAFSLIGIL